MMESRLRGRDLFLLWAVVLLGPMAWSVSLVVLFWLTDPVCQGAARQTMWAAGGACALLAIASGAGASTWLMRTGSPPERVGIAPFLQRMAMGLSAIFALVILLSMVPIALLTPCRV